MKRVAIAAILLSIIFAAAWIIFPEKTLSHLEIGGKTIALPIRDVFSKTEIKDVSEQRAPITVVFGGDVMFDRYIRTAMHRYGDDYALGARPPIIAGADCAVANLEGPITKQPSVSETSELGSRENYIFTFPEVTGEILSQSGFDVVSLGNNHILNFKEEGVRSTEEILARSGVGFFGSPLSGEERFLIRDIGGIRVAFVNYNQFVFHGEERAFEGLSRARAGADVVVVYAHWGKEYEPALPETKELAHRFIDAGADAVIGSHPHIVQEKEMYKDKAIYYSLGNLVFDQYFREDTMHGLLVRMMIDPVTKALSYEDIPVVLKRTGETVLQDR